MWSLVYEWRDCIDSAVKAMPSDSTLTDLKGKIDGLANDINSGINTAVSDVLDEVPSPHSPLVPPLALAPPAPPVRAVPRRADFFLLGDRPPILGSVTAQPPSVTANCRQLHPKRVRFQPTAVGLQPNCRQLQPTAVGLRPTAVGYIRNAFGSNQPPSVYSPTAVSCSQPPSV